MKSWILWLENVRPTIRWSIWLAYGCLWSLALLTQQPVEIKDRLFDPDFGRFLGKALHISAYCGLAMLTGWLRPRSWLRLILINLLFLHAFGTEFIQQFVDRGSDLNDVGLDIIGLTIGQAITWKWWLSPNEGAT
jgi:VanZ family protein